MTAVTAVLFVFGLVLLVAGAEALVRGASRLAALAGISPLVIGLTVVAFGTSSPELAVSAQSALSGQADIALGNVVGSNIFNVAFILGLSSLIVPLLVAQQLVKLDVPIMIGVSLLLYGLAQDGSIGRWDGALLFAGILLYVLFLLRLSRRESAQVVEEYEEAFGDAGTSGRSPGAILRSLAYVAAGLGMLVLGSNWLVDGAVAMATAFGVSQLVIGLTIVAAGTSLPEVATSVVASLRGERDIAVGNVVGSNIFNILAVLGVAGMLAPAGVAVSAVALRLDIPLMIGIALACAPIFFTGSTISRREGILFLTAYVAYTTYLILQAAGSGLLPAFVATMSVAIPLVAAALLLSALLFLRQQRQGTRA